MKFYLLAVAIILSASCAHAQESRSETQSIRCAALALIHTSMSASNRAFGDAMTQWVQLYGAIFGSARSKRTGSAPTMGQIFDRRELIQAEFKDSWKTNPDAVVREAALCNAWRAEFGPRLVATNRDRDDEATFVQIVGEPPMQPTAEEVERWRPIVPMAFAAWAQLDYATRSSVRKQLEDSIKKP